METLQPHFAEFCDIKSYSAFENKLLRMSEMIFRFFLNGLSSDLILIDVFSTWNFYFAYIISLLCILFNKDYVLVLRGGNLPARFKNSKKMLHRIFNDAKHIIAPSHYLKTFFEKEGYKILYIPNIIDLQVYNFQTRNPVAPTILNIRGFGKIYNPQMTVRAIDKVREDCPSVRLSLLGSDYADGTLTETEDLINELGLENHIEIIGKMTRDEWITYSQNFDIMVSNPIIDNTPVSVIEGMALGLLIISTDVGGISYLLTDKVNSLLVPSNDHIYLAAAIRQLIEHPDLASKLQTDARKKAEEFSWEKIKPLWEKILS